MATQNFRVKNGLEVGIGATILVAENNGNIGINSTTPTQKLDVAGTARIEGLIFGSGTEVTSVDADLNAVSSSHDTLASAKAIKDYVDTQITGEDLDFSGDSGTGSVDFDSQSLSISGTTNEIETSASGQTLTIGLPDEVSIASTLTVASSTTIDSTGIDISTDLTVDGLSDLDELNVAGLSTFASNVDINAGLDVDGHTELDNLNVSGVSTFQGNVNLGDNDRLRFGDGEDLEIYHDGNNSYIREGGTGALRVGSSRFEVRNPGDSKVSVSAFPAGEVELYYDNSKKFETTDAGVIITGIATATTFSGSGASLTNIPNGALDNSSVNFGGVTLSLGQSDTTPAFDLTDATNYPYTSLTGISTDIVYDTTPQLGGDLDLNSNNITGTGNIDITGISTATTLHAEGGTYNAGIDTKTDVALIIDEETSIYTRDGGNRLRNLIEKKSDVIIIGQQGTSLTDGIELQPGAAGSVKLHFGSTQSNVKLQTTSTGIDVTGHTETDTLNVSGVSTFQGNINLGDSDELRFGGGHDLLIYSNGTNGIIRTGSGSNLIYRSASHKFRNQAGTEELAVFTENGSVDLYYEDSKKFETVGTGVSISSGTASTATIYGPGNLIIDPAPVDDNGGIVRIKGDLYVDGTTTEINSTTLTIDDLNIVVASGATNSTAADGAGITVDGASATLQYATSGDKWVFNKAPYYNANRLLTTADEGSGNGIDSDTLDGQEGTHYLDYSNFVGIATDSDKLDGQQGTYYLDYSNFSGIATDSDKLDGQQGTYYLDYSNFSGIATDSDKLDGQQGTYYLDYANFSGIATDSDKLDGQQGTYYLNTSATSQTKNGDLGLGTSPTQKLDVNGAVRLRGAVYDNSNSAGTSSKVLKSTGSGVEWGTLADLGGISGVTIADDNSSTSVFNIAFTDSSGSSITELDVSSSNLTYKPEGKLGIGTSNPSVTLDVNGDLTVSGVSTFSDDLIVGTATTGVVARTDGTLNVSGVSTFQSDIVASSTLTIGNASGITGGAPADQGVLSVYGRGKNALIIQTDSNTDSRGVAFRNSGDAYIGYISMEDVGSNLGDMTFGVSNSTENNITNIDERVRFTKDGDVGIGTNSPTTKLDVRGGLNVTGVSIFGAGITITGIATATTFSGSGASLTNIPNSALDNSSVSFGGVEVVLGATDATPAFDLQDATNYPYTSLTGISTEILYDTTPQLGGNLDLNSNNITGTGNMNVTGIVTATTFSGSGASLTNIPTSSLVGLATDSQLLDGIDSTSFLRSDVADIKTAGHLTFNDNIQARFGTDAELKIYHNGTKGFITNSTVGNLVIQNNVDDADVVINSDDGSGSTTQYFRAQGSTGEVRLYYYGSQKLATKSNGIDVTGHTETDTLNVSGIATATAFHTGAEGSAIRVTSNTISGPAELFIDPSAVGDNTGAVRIKGDLYVDGTTTQINSTTIELADFIVGIATTATSDLLADGAGITIGPDNTLLYDHTNTALKSSENLNIASGKTYKINGTDVLSATTLGSNVVNSSLTSVGTLTELSVTGIVTANTFSGSGASLTSIPNSALTNSSIAIGGVTFNLGDTDATPAFDLQDATNYPYTSLTGISTEIVYDTTPQLGGDLDLNSNNITGTGNMNVTGIVTATTFSGAADFTGIVTAGAFSGSGASLTNIPNSALTNSSIAIGGVTFNLGDTDATPAFDLSDATNYPYTSLTGISTEILYDTTPQLGGNLDLNSKLINGTGGINITGVVTATSFNGIIEVSTDTSPQLGGNLNVNGRNINFGDSASASDDRLNFGAGTDLSVYFDGTNSYIDVNPDAQNHLYIRNNVGSDQGGNIYLQAKSGKQSIVCYDDDTVELYYNNAWRLYTSATGVSVNGVGIGTWKATDNRHLIAGTGDDFKIYHNGADTYLDNDTGHIYIRNSGANNDSNIYIQAVDGEHSIICADDSTVELYHDNTWRLYTTATGVSVNGTGLANASGGGWKAGDGAYLTAGDGDDLKIYHDGNHSYIDADPDADNQHLYIRNNVTTDHGGNIYLQAKSGKQSIVCYDDSAVELYHDTTWRFSTSATGVSVNGTGVGNWKVNDDAYLTAGTGDDFQIYHDGSSTYLDNDTGNIYIRNNVAADVNGDIYIQAKSGKQSIICYDDSAVELYHNNSVKFYTTTGGVNVTGQTDTDTLYVSETLNVSGISTFQSDVHLGDNDKLHFGTDDDLHIYHSGSHGYLDNDTGHLYIRCNVAGFVGGDIRLMPQDDENGIIIHSDGAVELYHDNDKKFETTDYGVTISGGMNVSGVTTSTDFNTTSDQNLKTNIQTIEDPLEKIVQIRGVNFEWKENNKPSAGVIAQEIEKVLPQLVNGSDTKTVNYNGLIGLLIETVKEQQKQIDNLNTRLSKLE